MATIVIHKEDGKHYILLGTGYSYFKDTSPSFLGGTLFPNEDEGKFEMAAVCDENGKILWIPTQELLVLQLDNITPNKILEKFIKDNEAVNADEGFEECPACGQKVKYSDMECPGCGLTFVSEEKG